MTLESQSLNLNARQIIFKRLSTVQALAYTGPLGEIVIDTTLKLIRVQDGVTPGGTLMITSTVAANLQSQIDSIKSNLDPAALDSLTEIVANVNALLANNVESQLVNSGFYANLTSTGNLVVPGSLLPKTHLAQDLGSPTQSWRDLYISNATAYFGNAMLTITNHGLQVFNSNNQPMPFIGAVKLPDGSLITSSGNIGGGGAANTGNITFNNITIQGVGDEYGGGGIYLSPDPSVTANLMYFRVRGGDSPTHLHFDTGNGSVYDQYFGDDGKYLKLGADGNISVGTSSGIWTFGTDGNLTLPQTAMDVSPAPTSLPGITWTDGTLQTTAFTGSSAKVDIVNTNGLSTTYYPTFVESRTSGQYVRADVDLTYRTDSNLLRSGNIQVGHNIYGSYRSGISNAIQFRPNIAVDKRFLFTVDSINGDYVRSGMEMPDAEVDKAVTLAFPHANSNAGFIYIQGLDSGATDFNDAFNIMMNSGNVKISALSYANGNKVWTFDTTGNLTLPQTVMNVSPAPFSLPGIRFTDGSLQTTAFTGTEFPTNIVNTHGGSAVIYVGGTDAFSESLSVRVANVSSTLGVEVKYSHAVTVSISAFRAYPNPANIYSGLSIKSGSNNDWDNFGNLVTVGDSMSVSISDHSNHKIYRVSVTARSMPGGGVAGDAYCVIEKLKL